MPSDLADLLADADVNAAIGALFDDGKALGRLIERPTTPVEKTVAKALNSR